MQPSLSRREAEPPANEIAGELSESNPNAVRQIVDLVRYMGVEFARGVLSEALEIERGGGMLVPDGSRRRTPGGVFFYLARQKLTPEMQAIIFPPPHYRKDRRAPAKPDDDPLPAAPAQDEAGPPAEDAESRLPVQATPAATATPVEPSPEAIALAARHGVAGAESLAILDRAQRAVGVAALHALAEEAQADAREGGIEGVDGVLLRAAGDILVYLAYGRIPPGERSGLATPSGHRATPRAPVKPLPAATAAAKPARGATVKMTIIGRPARVDKRQDYVVLAMDSAPMPPLPKGLPSPPAAGEVQAFVSARQWGKVEQPLQAAPDDLLIIEGYATLHRPTGKIACYATSVVTRAQQQAKRQAAGQS